MINSSRTFEGLDSNEEVFICSFSLDLVKYYRETDERLSNTKTRPCRNFWKQILTFQTAREACYRNGVVGICLYYLLHLAYDLRNNYTDI